MVETNENQMSECKRNGYDKIIDGDIRYFLKDPLEEENLYRYIKWHTSIQANVTTYPELSSLSDVKLPSLHDITCSTGIENLRHPQV